MPHILTEAEREQSKIRRKLYLKEYNKRRRAEARKAKEENRIREGKKRIIDLTKEEFNAYQREYRKKRNASDNPMPKYWKKRKVVKPSVKNLTRAELLIRQKYL